LFAVRTTRRAFLKSAAAAASAPLWGAARPQFSLAHLTVLGCPPAEATQIAARAGYDFVSYRIISMGLANEPNYDLARNGTMLRETAAVLRSTGIKLHDIELGRIADNAAVKTYAPALQAAAELGARRVIASIWTARRSFAIDSLAELCDLAGKVGLSISLEFVTWAEVASLRQALDVLRAVHRPNLGLLIDTLHFHRSRVRLEELDSVPREWFHFAHVCDGPAEIPSAVGELIRTGREARLYPGEGAIDIAAIVGRMPAIPYSLEIPNLARVKELGYAEHARRCLESARAYFAAHAPR
jgi:sugar phosphate isomerase/epimerase